MFKKIILLFLLSASTLAQAGLKLGNSSPIDQADSCSEKDFRKELPDTRNQGDIGWCYAYTAADMLSQRLKMNVSAFDVAITFNHLVNGQLSLSSAAPLPLKDGKSYYESGDVNGAVNAMASARGVCPESVIRSEKFVFDVPLEYKQPTSALRYAETLGKRVSKTPALKNSSCASRNPIFTLFDSHQIAEILGEAASPEKWFNLAQKSCNDHRVAIDSEMTTATKSIQSSSADELLAEIDNQLSRGLATGVDYDAKYIPRTDKLPTISFTESFKKLRGDVLAPHSSLIVGRKRDPKTRECKYLIRNSWSNDCRDIANCEDGNFWVSSKWLKKYMFGVTYWN